MKNIKAPRLVIIASLTLATVVIWIVFGIIRIVTAPDEVNVPQELMEPLNPTLDTEILSNLESRTHLSEQDLGAIVIQPVPTPEPIVPEEESLTSPLPESTAEESATPTPSASPTPTP